MAEEPRATPTGRIIGGRYRLQSVIAHGGMATVYLATDERLDRPCAVKVMHATYAADPQFVERFEREARSAARLAHPAIVAVYDQGRDVDLVYLVMEYIPGRTLRELIHERAPLPADTALRLLETVLDALSAAHATGLVHRDIKPENLLLSEDGQVTVADFGLAKRVSTATAPAQRVILGTVDYLAPEQVSDGIADARSDVYAAGICLYEMLTGSVPHTGDTPIAVAYQHVNADVPAPSHRRPGLPPEVDALVLRATRRDPRQRYPDASAFLVDVRRVLERIPPDARVSPSTPAAVTQPLVKPTRVMDKRPSVSPAMGRSPGRSILVGIVLLTLGIAAAIAAGWYLARF